MKPISSSVPGVCDSLKNSRWSELHKQVEGGFTQPCHTLRKVSRVSPESLPASGDMRGTARCVPSSRQSWAALHSSRGLEEGSMCWPFQAALCLEPPLTTKAEGLQEKSMSEDTKVTVSPDREHWTENLRLEMVSWLFPRRFIWF